MSESFNSYYAFLGLDEELTNPNYYQVLRLRPSETDPAKINAAADKAAARVRSQQPGEHVQEWSQLLDEVKAARACLLDPAHRAAYDAHLDSDGASPSPGPAATAAPSMNFIAPPQANFAFPPGVGPGPMPVPSYGAPTPSPPTFPQTSSPWSPAPSAHTDPMAPMPMPSPPMAPAAYGWSPPAPPAGPMFAPPVGPAPNSALDPMAPVAFPSPPEPPLDRGRIVGFAGGNAPGVSNSLFAPRAPFANLNPVPLGNMATSTAVPVGLPTAAPVAVVAQPVSPTPIRPIGRKRHNPQLGLLAGIGGLAVVLIGLIAWSLNKGDDEEVAGNGDPGETHPVKPPTKPEPEQPKPEIPPEPKPEPKPETPIVNPMPEPKPETPDPEMVKPEPVKPIPEPKPEPKPEPMNTPEELAELTKLATEAKAALGDHKFEEAKAHLEKAASLAKMKPHQDKLERLKRVADMAKAFHDSIKATMTILEVGEVIKIGTSTEAAIVEASPEKVTIRVQGSNKSYTVDDMPLGVAMSFGEQSLNPDAPTTKVFKGAFVFLDKRATASQREKVKVWWEEAQSGGEDVSDLMPVLEDSYDFTKE